MGRWMVAWVLVLAGCCPCRREYLVAALDEPTDAREITVRLVEGCGLHLDRLQLTRVEGGWVLLGRIHALGHRMIPVWKRVLVRALDDSGREISAAAVDAQAEGEVATRPGVRAVRFEASVPAPEGVARLEIARIAAPE